MDIGSSIRRMPALDYARLASLYDGLVTDRGDLEFLLRAAREANGPVAEFMAGTGRLAVPMAEAGIDITCVDSSREMLRVLQEKLAAKGLRARTVCDDVTRVNVGGTFALVFITFHSFEELLTEADQRACLETVRRHLRPDGRFICTLHDVPSRLAAVGPGKAGRWHFTEPGSGRGVSLALESGYDSQTGIVTGLESFTYASESTPFLRVPLQFRLVSPEAFRRLARDAGFDVESVRSGFTAAEYVEGESPTAVWTLRPSP